MNNLEVTVDQEIANVSIGKPHVILLGAGASKAALPNGDKYGRPVPLLNDLAVELKLVNHFPDDLKVLAEQDFEAAYSRLFDRGPSHEITEIDGRVRTYFASLELPEEPNLYDVITLSLRDKDVIATFNWDPFLMQSRIRLAKLGITTKFPKLFYLHGNVTVGFCVADSVSGLSGRDCKTCNQPFVPSQLLYPVEHKDYQSDPFIKREWEAVQYYLKNCFMFSIFGYSAPVTDVEAVKLLMDGWGDPNTREMEQTEVINRPGANVEDLRKTWDPFIHSHHYDIFGSFYDSFIAKHPRRSIEAYWEQYWEAKFISDNPVPQHFTNFDEMVKWFQPLISAEEDKTSSS